MSVITMVPMSTVERCILKARGALTGFSAIMVVWMRSTVQKRRRTSVIESVNYTPVMMSGTVTGILITTGTSVKTVKNTYLLISFVIAVKAVAMVMMKVTVIMLQHVPGKNQLYVLLVTDTCSLTIADVLRG